MDGFGARIKGSNLHGVNSFRVCSRNGLPTVSVSFIFEMWALMAIVRRYGLPCRVARIGCVGQVAIFGSFARQSFRPTPGDWPGTTRPARVPALSTRL